MRKAPRERADSPERQYDKLLVAGIALQKEYLIYLRQIMDWDRGGRKDIAAGLRDNLAGPEARIVEELAKRVRLLRGVGDLDTMDSVDAQLNAGSASEVASLFERGGADAHAAPAREVRVTSAAVSDGDDGAFFEARKALALKMGYDVEENGPDWFRFSRHNVTIEIWQSRSPSTNGVTGNDRIMMLNAGVEERESRRMKCLYQPSNDSFEPCTDPAVQREVDRAIAIFG